MYKVLNLDGDKIVVESINPQIHRHLSGREFNDDDICVSKINKEPKEDVVIQGEVELSEDMEREIAIEKYVEKFGKKPHHKMKLENIIEKLNA